MKKLKTKGNKYTTFSKANKTSEGGATVDSSYKTYGNCPRCDCCESSRLGNKINLCYNCFYGLNHHPKLGTPKLHLTNMV